MSLDEIKNSPYYNKVVQQISQESIDSTPKPVTTVKKTGGTTTEKTTVPPVLLKTTTPSTIATTKTTSTGGHVPISVKEKTTTAPVITETKKPDVPKNVFGFPSIPNLQKKPAPPEKTPTEDYNTFEKTIAKTKPDLAKKLYEKRTGYTPATETTTTTMDLKAMLEQGPPPEGAYQSEPGGPIKIKTVEENTRLNAQRNIPPSIAKQYGVKVYDEDYISEIARLSSNITNTETSIDNQRRWLSEYPSWETTMNQDIRMVQDSPTDSIWQMDINNDGTPENFTRQQALDYLNKELTEGQESRTQVETNIPETETDLRQMKIAKTYLEEYKNQGYYLDIKDNKYVFSEPKASEVVEKLYGNRPDVYIAQEMRTMGFGMLMAGGQQLITGQESIEAEKESTAQSILGATRRPGESIESHAQRFWTSGETIADVWLPLATLGASKGLTIAGRTIAPYVVNAGGKITRTVGPTGTKIIGGMKAVGQEAGQILSKPGMSYAMKYGMFGALESQSIIDTAQSDTALIGPAIGKSLFRFETTWKMMDVGLEGGIRPREQWITRDIKATQGIPESVQQQQTLGVINVVQEPVSKTQTRFIAGGEVIVKTGKQAPVEMGVEAYGVSREIKALSHVKGTESEATGVFKWSEKKGFTEYTHMRVRPLEGNAFEVAEAGDQRIISSVDTSMGTIEPTAGENITRMRNLTDIEGKGSAEFYESQGRYSNILEDVTGNERTIGVVFTKESQKAFKETGETKVVDLIKPPGPGFKRTPYVTGSEKKSVVEGITKEKTPTTDIGSRLTSEAKNIAEEETTGTESIIKPMFGKGITLSELEAMEYGIGGQSEHWNFQRSHGQGTTSITELTREQKSGELGEQKTGELGAQEEDLFRGNLTRTRQDTDQGRRSEEKRDYGLGTRTNQDVNQRQEQKQDQLQLTRQEFGSQLQTTNLIRPTPRTITEPIHIRPPIFPRQKKQEEPIEKKNLMTTTRRHGRTITSRRQKKGLTADLLSVTQSQARTGKATQPKTTKALWAESEKSLFLRTPTEELQKGKKKRGLFNIIGNKKGGKKNVYY